jgi:rhodanese-related sulfurtransferase
MPLSKLDAKEVTDLNAGKIVVICHTGRRSKKAVERLIEYGIKDVYSVRDGRWLR